MASKEFFVKWKQNAIIVTEYLTICSIRSPADPASHDARSAPHAPTKLPFRLIWGYLVIVEGSIAKLQKLNFLVDNGARPSIVDRKIAQNLGLAEQAARVNLSNKTI